MRTDLANRTIEVAFMLLCWPKDAPVDAHSVWWARKTLAQNGELRPDQIEGIAAE